jgi:hypothetical protein
MNAEVFYNSFQLHAKQQAEINGFEFEIAGNWAKITKNGITHEVMTRSGLMAVLMNEAELERDV